MDNEISHIKLYIPSLIFWTLRKAGVSINLHLPATSVQCIAKYALGYQMGPMLS